MAQLHQREDRLRVDRHVLLAALDPVARKKLVVVLDDSVVDTYHAAVANGVVVAPDLRVALRVVADMEKRL